VGAGFHTDASVADVEIGGHQRICRSYGKTCFYCIVPAWRAANIPRFLALFAGVLRAAAPAKEWRSMFAVERMRLGERQKKSGGKSHRTRNPVWILTDLGSLAA
jgi:hypothetical protein